MYLGTVERAGAASRGWGVGGDEGGGVGEGLAVDFLVLYFIFPHCTRPLDKILAQEWPWASGPRGVVLAEWGEDVGAWPGVPDL